MVVSHLESIYEVPKETHTRVEGEVISPTREGQVFTPTRSVRGWQPSSKGKQRASTAGGEDVDNDDNDDNDVDDQTGTNIVLDQRRLLQASEALHSKGTCVGLISGSREHRAPSSFPRGDPAPSMGPGPLYSNHIPAHPAGFALAPSRGGSSGRPGYGSVFSFSGPPSGGLGTEGTNQGQQRSATTGAAPRTPVFMPSDCSDHIWVGCYHTHHPFIHFILSILSRSLSIPIHSYPLLSIANTIFQVLVSGTIIHHSLLWSIHLHSCLHKPGSLQTPIPALETSESIPQGIREAPPSVPGIARLHTRIRDLRLLARPLTGTEADRATMHPAGGRVTPEVRRTVVLRVGADPPDMRAPHTTSVRFPRHHPIVTLVPHPAERSGLPNPLTLPDTTIAPVPILPLIKADTLPPALAHCIVGDPLHATDDDALVLIAYPNRTPTPIIMMTWMTKILVENGLIQGTKAWMQTCTSWHPAYTLASQRLCRKVGIYSFPLVLGLCNSPPPISYPIRKSPVNPSTLSPVAPSR
ncbi:hypothetical protein GYMLUDRAFT_982831 [Collybiopsis luxurians FD-317 M1]|uniref:Unplaced genomic scaffold GYMLUscaffold_126, whole genome shotgun sequence n=1 Tax=Collybiopsis luxurians FD-317 M1 TaxID=944289 RepID=A0A0D0B9Y9_9AGAR|nr:hypothetical protein GYMLUDRAFT_982831 [Collybiopsis luxurians FD-317 M1]